MKMTTKQHRWGWAGSDIYVNPEFQKTLNKKVQSVDLFCGGGGFAEGAIQAGAEVVIAILLHSQ